MVTKKELEQRIEKLEEKTFRDEREAKEMGAVECTDGRNFGEFMGLLHCPDFDKEEWEHIKYIESKRKEENPDYEGYTNPEIVAKFERARKKYGGDIPNTDVYAKYEYDENLGRVVDKTKESEDKPYIGSNDHDPDKQIKKERKKRSRT